MPAERRKIVCIYCKELKLASREHVLLRALGGTETAWILCLDCNGRLSVIDQALAERSIVALSRMSDTPPDSFKVKIDAAIFYLDEKAGYVVEMGLRNGMTPEILPQIHLVSRPGKPEELGISIATNGDPAELARLDVLVSGALAEGRLRSLYVKEEKRSHEITGTTARLVLHRRRDALIRVPKGQPEKANQLFEQIERLWAQAVAARRQGENVFKNPVTEPKLRVGQSIVLDDVHRAVAKIGFNVMAARLGSEFALRPEFDPIRSYILGDDVCAPEPLLPNQIAVDPRFVHHGGFGPCYIPSEDHTVLLASHGSTLCAMVGLYGKHEFLVHLGDAKLPRFFVYSLTEYSKARGDYRILNLDETCRRIAERRLA